MDKVQPFEFGGAVAKPGLIDPFGREISYLRVSVTDRARFPLRLLHVRKHVIST